MVKLYKSTNGIVHLVLAGYICNHAIGKVTPNMEGTAAELLTCKNCKARINPW